MYVFLCSSEVRLRKYLSWESVWGRMDVQVRKYLSWVSVWRRKDVQVLIWMLFKDIVNCILKRDEWWIKKCRFVSSLLFSFKVFQNLCQKDDLASIFQARKWMTKKKMIHSKTKTFLFLSRHEQSKTCYVK